MERDKIEPVEELQARGVARRRGQATGHRWWPQNPPQNLTANHYRLINNP